MTAYYSSSSILLKYSLLCARPFGDGLLSMIYYIALLNFCGTLSSLETWIRPAPLTPPMDLLPSFLRCFPALRRCRWRRRWWSNGGLHSQQTIVLFFFGITYVHAGSKPGLVRIFPAEPFALWRQRVNKSSKGGDQSLRRGGMR